MRLPLSLSLHPSRSAAALLIVVHGVAVAAITVCQIAWLFKFLLLLPLALSMVLGLRNHVWRQGSRAIVSLVFDSDGKVELTYADTRCISTQLDASSTVLHWFMALRLRHEGRVVSLFLLPDMLDADSWRHLSVLLRAAKTDG